MYVYASELRQFWHFYILKLLFLSIFCRYGMLINCRLNVLTNFQIYRQTLTLSKCMCTCERAEGASLENFGLFAFLNCYFVQYFVGTNDMLVGLHVPTNFLIYRQTLTLSKCMCMRASGASELRKFWNFYILNLLFLSIFCRYIRYFVCTNDTLVGSHVPTNFRKSIIGGGGQLPPPPPPLATLMLISWGVIPFRFSKL